MVRSCPSHYKEIDRCKWAFLASNEKNENQLTGINGRSQLQMKRMKTTEPDAVSYKP